MSEVIFCSRCVMSNQRPSSSVEFRHDKDHQHRLLQFTDGVCDACRFAEKKRSIDWEQREKELLVLLDQHRGKYGEFDCIVPGSGGKDSMFAAHVLKHKYGMSPLTVTWQPLLYTDVGLRNFSRWQEIAPNIVVEREERVHATLTRLAIENLLHPFQPFILGQKNAAPNIAYQHLIPLVFYGEHEAEYGNPIAEGDSPSRHPDYFSSERVGAFETKLAGVSLDRLRTEYGLSLVDVKPYLPLQSFPCGASEIDVRYLGYYLKWTPQEAYYYAVEHCGFEANPVRTEGTYSKYNSLDDKIDGLHYYTTYIKFGLGRASYDAAQEIRNNHLTREEGVGLVKRFDGEFPIRYFHEVMDYVGMKPTRFLELCEQWKSPHLWKDRKLRHQVS